MVPQYLVRAEFIILFQYYFKMLRKVIPSKKQNAIAYKLIQIATERGLSMQCLLNPLSFEPTTSNLLYEDSRDLKKAKNANLSMS